MRYALATLLILFLLIVGIVIVASGGDDSPSGDPLAKVTNLSDSPDKSQTTVSWTVQGELVGDDRFRSVRVTVSETERVFEVLAGYENRVIERETFKNNQNAFATFLDALDNANFGRERTSKQSDERGVCPFGNRFVYTISNPKNEGLRTWSDTCTRSSGTYGGVAATTRRLFTGQITDYNRLVSGVRL